MSEPILRQATHLGELHIPRSADSFFIFGETLAAFNAQGCYFYPDVTQSIRFNAQKGRWIIWAAGNKHEAAVDPEVASWQFRDLPAEHQDILPGLLGGYARGAYQYIEPDYPGYTQAFLGHLIGGPVLSLACPRQPCFDLARVLAAYGCCLEFRPDQIQLAFTLAPGAATPGQDLDLLLATIILTLAGVDVTRWIRQVETVDESGEMAQILGALSRQEHLNTWGGLIPKLLGPPKAQKRVQALLEQQPYPAGCLLLFMQGLYAGDKKPPTSLFDGNLFALLKAATDKLLAPAAAERQAYLEAMIDGLDDLAHTADQQGDTVLSMHLAQASQMVLQLIALDHEHLEGLEERLTRAQMQEAAYSWHQLSPAGPQAREHLLHYLAFAVSATLADLKCFTTTRQLFAAGHTSNHLWTAVWGALNRQRKALQLAYAISLQEETWQAHFLPAFGVALENAVKSYIDCLVEFGTAVKSTVTPHEPTSNYFHCFSGDLEKDKDMFLFREQKGTLQLLQALQHQGFGPAAQAALQELVSGLEEA